MTKTERWIAIDANILDCIIYALHRGELPPPSNHDLADQQVAAFRLFLWELLAVGEIAERECMQTNDQWKKDWFWRLASGHLHQIAVQRDRKETCRDRARELQAFHPSENDCFIVAEAETAGVEALLTNDRKLIRRLGLKARVGIKTPADQWAELAIPRGTPPRFSPRPDNPLFYETFWRWD